jgi:hypothetical protein
MGNEMNKMWMQVIATETGFETLVIGDDDGVVADCHFSWRPYNENESNAKLIVSAVNGCKSINGDNPQVVAENIIEMVKMLNDLAQEVPITHPVFDLLNKIREAK